MRRKQTITFSLVVTGALLIVAAAHNFTSDWGSQGNVDVPAASAYWTQFEPPVAGRDSLTPVTVAVPPYIIMSALRDTGDPFDGEGQIRITIETVYESGSGYAASQQPSAIAEPVVYLGAPGRGTFGRSKLDLSVWD